MKFKSDTRRVVMLVGLLALVPRAAWSQANPCDLNNDGTVNVVDVQLAINMALGVAPCTANINGIGVCNVVVVQRVINNALGGSCVVNPHTVSLNWTASTSASVAGYYVYRSIVSGGPYTKLNATLVTGTSYLDGNVSPGQTYFYVTTAVDSSNDESVYSNEAEAIVPSP